VRGAVAQKGLSDAGPKDGSSSRVAAQVCTRASSVHMRHCGTHEPGYS